MATLTHQKPTLYKRGKGDKVLIWFVEYDTPNGRYRKHSGQVGGKITPNGWTKVKAKGKNSVTEQLDADIQSLYTRQLDQGEYWEDEKDIDRVRYMKPMLANKFIERYEKGKVTFPVMVQRKFDGTRCVTHTAANGICERGAGMWSRNGKQNHTCPHVFEEFNLIVGLNGCTKLVLDGENYSHGTTLGDIAGMCSVNKKLEDITAEEFAETEKNIKYFVYDGWDGVNTFPETPYEKRLERLQELLKYSEHIEVAETFECHNMAEVMELMERFVADGYEGAIIRDPKSAYKFDRGDQLLKLKKFEQGEFNFIRFVPAEKGSWAGIPKVALVEMDIEAYDRQGNRITEFEVNLRGSMEELKLLAEQEEDFVGQPIITDYQQRSKYGVPLIPFSSMVVRDYE